MRARLLLACLLPSLGLTSCATFFQISYRGVAIGVEFRQPASAPVATAKQPVPVAP